MKLYKAPPRTVVRIEIIERGNASKTITVDEQDSLVVSNNLREILNQEFPIGVNPMVPTKKISIQCYDYTDKKKGVFNTFTVYCMSVEQIYQIILENLEA